MNRYIPIGALAALLLASPAQAQTQCAPIEQVEAALRDRFAEKPLIEWDVQISEGSPTRTVRAYANTQSGSLTLLMIFESEGRVIGCMAGSGTNMRIAPQFKPQEHPL